MPTFKERITQHLQAISDARSADKTNFSNLLKIVRDACRSGDFDEVQVLQGQYLATYYYRNRPVLNFGVENQQYIARSPDGEWGRFSDIEVALDRMAAIAARNIDTASPPSH